MPEDSICIIATLARLEIVDTKSKVTDSCNHLHMLLFINSSSPLLISTVQHLQQAMRGLQG